MSTNESKHSNAPTESRSIRQRYAEEGCINAAFTLNGWFVKIKPAYAIDKVIFSFVAKGSSGKQSFNVYVDLDIFDLWMDDVSSFRMLRKLQEENAAGKKYPEAYKVVTGENGSYMVGFCVSTKENMIAINGSGKHKENGAQTGDTLRAFIPVSYDWLRITAKYYKRTCLEHFKKLATTILTESSSYHSPDQGVLFDDGSTFAPASNIPDGAGSANTGSTAKEPVKKKKSAASSNKGATDSESRSAASKKEKSKKAAAASNTPTAPVTQEHSITYNMKSCEKVEIDTQTPICYDGAHYKLLALDAEGKQRNIVITSDISQKLGDKFKDLRAACQEAANANRHIHLTMLYRSGVYDTCNVLFLHNLA